MASQTGPVDFGDALYFKGKTLREQTTSGMLVVNSTITRPSWILSSQVFVEGGGGEGKKEDSNIQLAVLCCFHIDNHDDGPTYIKVF
jgi:hypothetical protein